MFEASVDGQAYDAERWGNYYKPRGVQIDTANSAPVAQSSTPVAQTATASVDEDEDVPFAPTTSAVVEDAPAPTAPIATPAAGGTQRAEDILAMIRNRQKTN